MKLDKIENLGLDRVIKRGSAEIIEALQAEIAGKNSGSSYKGLGQIVNKMGF